DDNLARLRAWLGLKAHPEPAVRFAALFKTARCNGVCKDEEGLLRPEFCVEPLDQKTVFVVEHCLEPNPTDVAIRRSVDCVAKCHIVRRHGLRDSASGAADTEKPASHFLARPNLCKRPVLRRVQIDLQRLSIGGDFHLWSHTISLRRFSIAANNPGR